MLEKKKKSKSALVSALVHVTIPRKNLGIQFTKIAIYTSASFPCHRRGQLNEQESRRFQQTFASQKAKVHSQLTTVEGKGACGVGYVNLSTVQHSREYEGLPSKYLKLALDHLCLLNRSHRYVPFFLWKQERLSTN